jgi:hypothetical protein
MPELIVLVVIGTIGPFLIARRRFGAYQSAVALAIGLALGALTGFALQTGRLFQEERTAVQVIEEWIGADARHGIGSGKWNWLVIAALLGVLVSFLSLMFIGPRFIRRVDDARQPIIGVSPPPDPDLPQRD